MNRAAPFLFVLFIANGAIAHPLEEALRNINKTKVQLDTIANQNSDSDLVAEASRIQKNVASIWIDTFLAPMRASDTKLNKLGYGLEEYNSVLHYYQLQTNPNAESMDRDAEDLKADRWLKLKEVADDQMSMIHQIDAMLLNPEFSEGFTDIQKNAVVAVANDTRLAGLQTVRNRVATTLECIGYFSEAFARYGLVPIGDAGETIRWSPNDLYRVHGAHDINGLSAAQWTVVKVEIKDLYDKLLAYDDACVPIDHAAFLENQLYRNERD